MESNKIEKEKVGNADKFIYPCEGINQDSMRTREEYVAILHNHADELKQRFGIHSLRLFGSVARGEHQTGSDVDVCVEFVSDKFES